MKHETKKTEAPKGFVVTLGQIDDGCLHAEASEELQRALGELHRHAINTDKDAKGAVTVVVNLKVSPNATVSAHGEVKVKLPKPSRGSTTFFLTKSNNLSLENPKQLQLGLREVPPAPAAFVDLDRDARELRDLTESPAAADR
jgi:hypothetical protein